MILEFEAMEDVLTAHLMYYLQEPINITIGSGND